MNVEKNVRYNVECEDRFGGNSPETIVKKSTGNGLTWVILFFGVLLFPAVSGAWEIDETQPQQMMEQINLQLAATGQNVQIGTIEFRTIAGTSSGRKLLYKNQRKYLESHWVKGDPRRNFRTNLTWISDTTEGRANGLSFDETQAALEIAMANWNEAGCVNIPLERVNRFADKDLGYVQCDLGLGGTGCGAVPEWHADITHAGWVPRTVFDRVFGYGAGQYVLAMTITGFWQDENSNELTDIDGDGKVDVAFREIYYNNNFPWGINTSWPVDVQTIVAHEVGHGLSLNHFGSIFKIEQTNEIHYTPHALMNAGYKGIMHKLTATDLGGFCALYSGWNGNNDTK